MKLHGFDYDAFYFDDELFNIDLNNDSLMLCRKIQNTKRNAMIDFFYQQ